MAEKKRSRKLRLVLAALVLFIVVVLLAALLAPTIASTGFVRGIALGYVNDAVPGRIAVDSWSLSWTGPQRVAGLAIQSPDGQTILSVRDINAADLSLWSTIRGSTDFGLIKLDGIEGTIEQYADGTTNLHRALVGPETSEAKEPSSGDGASGDMPSARIEWADANLTIAAPGIEPVSVTGLKGHADLTDIAAIDLALGASVKQGKTVGRIDAKAKVTDLFDAAGTMQMADAGFDAEAYVRDLPVDAVDRVTAMQGRLTALLGPVLNAQLKASGKLSAADFSATIEASSEHLTQCRLVAGYSGNDLVLQPKSGLSLTITPATWAALTAGSAEQQATLLQPFTVRVDVSDMTVARDLSAGHINVALAVDDIVLDAADARIGRVALRKTSLVFASPQFPQKLTLGFDALAEQGGEAGTVHLDATVNLVPSASSMISYDVTTATANAKVQRVPLAVFDQLLAANGMIVDALGETVDAEVAASYDAQKRLGDAAVTARSATLTANLTARADDQQIAVVSGAEVQYTLRPAFANAFMGKDAPAKLLEPVTIKALVEQFTVPRGGESLDLRQSVVAVKVAAGDIRLDDGLVEPLVFAAPAMTLAAEGTGKPIRAAVGTTVQRGSRSGRIDGRATLTNAFTDAGAFNAAGMHAMVQVGASPQLLGSVRPLDKVGEAVGKLGEQPFALTLDAQMIEPTNAGTTAATFTYTLKAGEAEVNAPGKIDGDRLTLDTGASITAVVDQPLLDAFVGADPAAPAPYRLAAPAKLMLAVKQLDLIISGDKLGEGPLDVSLTSDALTLAATDPNAAASTITLKKVNAAATARNLREQVTVAGEADILTAGQTATVTFDAVVADALGVAVVKSAQLRAPALPTALLDALSGPDSNLAALLGSTLAIDVTAEPADKATKFNAAVNAPNLAVSGVGGVFTSGQSMTLDGGTEARFTLTPAAFAAMRPAGKATVAGTAKSTLARQVTGSTAQPTAAWTLQKPAAFSVKIPDAAVIGLTEANAVDFRKTSLKLAAAGEELLLARGSESYALRGLQAQVDMAKPAEAVTITADAEMSQVGSLGAGKLNSRTTLTHALAADGSLDLVGATINTDTRGSTLPAAMLDGLAGTDQQLSQMFGPVIEVLAAGDYPGKINLAVTGDLGRVAVPVDIDAQRVLTLQRDGEISLTATTELAGSVLRNINPFLADAVRGRDPIRITLNREGTRIPLKDFSIANCQAAAMVNLGTLELGEGGFIGQLRSLLGRSQKPVYNATFSPTAVQLAQGWLSYSGMRMDIEDEKLALVFATRMHVDPASARELEMTATVPGDVIAASVKELKGALGPDDGLTVPIRGTIDEPKPDMGGFKKSIADLVAKAAIRRGIGDAIGDDAAGEAAGKLLEGLLGGKKR